MSFIFHLSFVGCVRAILDQFIIFFKQPVSCFEQLHVKKTFFVDYQVLTARDGRCAQPI